jgi:mono/diheme cytochrome c family protein
MKIKVQWLTGILALAPAVWGAAPADKTKAANVPVARSAEGNTMRVEGERRFQANCGRCHAAPEKFPPRMMGTIVRHMRVRALITDEDMKLVLFYMTQ